MIINVLDVRGAKRRHSITIQSLHGRFYCGVNSVRGGQLNATTETRANWTSPRVPLDMMLVLKTTRDNFQWCPWRSIFHKIGNSHLQNNQNTLIVYDVVARETLYPNCAYPTNLRMPLGTTPVWNIHDNSWNQNSVIFMKPVYSRSRYLCRIFKILGQFPWVIES